jgi:hypothetical protein
MIGIVGSLFSGRIADSLQAIRNAFDAEPEMTVSLDQASALWRLAPDRLQPVLDALVDVRFLRRLSDGAYARRTSGLTAA